MTETNFHRYTPGEWPEAKHNDHGMSAQCADTRENFACTRIVGHNGRHEAGASHVNRPEIVAYWGDDDPPDIRWLVERPEGQGEGGRFEGVGADGGFTIEAGGALVFHDLNGKQLVAYNPSAWVTVVAEA